MAKKAYLEITNVCNLSCSFCHGTRREPRFMTAAEFSKAAEKLRPFADYLYFHLLGEPLLHPQVGEFLGIANTLGFRVNLTTNGTLLSQKGEEILSSAALHKVSISLHSYEVNSLGMSLDEYLDMCFEFCKKAQSKGVVAVMRLWNKGGADSMNERILAKMHCRFSGEWKEIYSGYKIEEYIFLEWGELFEWPDMDAPDFGASHSCYGLRDQVGVLSDGTVVPCCLDAEGDINLGNIFEEDLGELLSSERAEALRESFRTRNITEPLCRKCGYAARFRH